MGCGLERVTAQAVTSKAVTAQRVATQAVTAGHSELPCELLVVRSDFREFPASAALGARRTKVAAAAAAAAEMPATRRRVIVLRMRYSLQNVPPPMLFRRLAGA
jgi:hypothetical protein